MTPAYRFRLWLSQGLDDLAMWINPIPPVPEIELKKSSEAS